MELADLLPLFIVVPLAGAFLIRALPRRLAAFSDLLGNGAVLVLLAGALRLADQEGAVVCRLGGFAPPLGVVLVADGLARLLLLVIAAVAAAAALFAVAYMEQYTSKHRFYALFLLVIAGMNGVALAGDLFALYLAMELASLAAAALVAFGGERAEIEAAFKYLVMGTLASSLVLLGIALVYGSAGTLTLAHLATLISFQGPTLGLVLALGLFIVGFGLKAALVPFHAWLPDAHPAAPAPVSATLSGVFIKVIGATVLLRLLYLVFEYTVPVGRLLLGLGALSMVVGVVLALGQRDLKRLLAYSSVSQVGYIVAAFGLGTPLGVLAGLFHLVTHAAGKSLLFLSAGAVEYATGTRDLDALGGLRRRMPVTGAASLIGALSVAGVPPLAGFWSKLLIVVAAVAAGQYWLALLAVLVSVGTLAVGLRFQRAFTGPLPEAHDRAREVPLSMAAALVFLAVLTALLGAIYLGGLDATLAAARDAATGKGAYVRAVELLTAGRR